MILGGVGVSVESEICFRIRLGILAQYKLI